MNRHFEIVNGSRKVIVNEQDGFFWARLYVNNGETACHQHWSGKTEAGARRWAAKQLARYSTVVANA